MSASLAGQERRDRCYRLPEEGLERPFDLPSPPFIALAIVQRRPEFVSGLA